MVCPKCGRNLPKGSKFCQYCGIKIKQQQLINIKSINVFLAIGFVFSLIMAITLGYGFIQSNNKYEKGYEEGTNAVISAPVKYGLISRNDLEDHTSRYVECFQKYVTNNPDKFGLYTKSDMEDAYELGLDEMMYSILDNPEDYGLRY